MPRNGLQIKEPKNYDFTIRADELVSHGQSTAPGVFPGDRDRTTVAPIIPLDGSKGNDTPTLKQFREDSGFTLSRPHSQPCEGDPENGPALAHVMNWFWDPVAKQEVCYRADGPECMHHDGKTEEYSYPVLQE